jgi:hypothetical protein
MGIGILLDSKLPWPIVLRIVRGLCNKTNVALTIHVATPTIKFFTFNGFTQV